MRKLLESLIWMDHRRDEVWIGNSRLGMLLASDASITGAISHCENQLSNPQVIRVRKMHLRTLQTRQWERSNRLAGHDD